MTSVSRSLVYDRLTVSDFQENKLFGLDISSRVVGSWVKKGRGTEKFTIKYMTIIFYRENWSNSVSERVRGAGPNIKRRKTSGDTRQCHRLLRHRSTPTG